MRQARPGVKLDPMARWRRLALAAFGLLAGTACPIDDDSAGCLASLECVACVQLEGCGFCLESQTCVGAAIACSGDRALAVDMCEEELR